MARNYEKVAQAWANTTMTDPYKQEIIEGDGYWRIDGFLSDMGYIREILEDAFVGMNLSKCSGNVLDKLWSKMGSERLYKDWVLYNDKEEEVEKEYNLWWWRNNDIECYRKVDSES